MIMTKDYATADPRYSRAQVCAYMGGLDLTTLDKWVSAGKFPKPDLYLGRHPRWRLSTVNAYLSQKEHEHEHQSCS